jgi:hypothetical protein
LTANQIEIGNVKASVAPVAGELLLCQSFLSVTDSAGAKGSLRLFRGRAGMAIGSQVTQQRWGKRDRGKTL